MEWLLIPGTVVVGTGTATEAGAEDMEEDGEVDGTDRGVGCLPGFS